MSFPSKQPRKNAKPVQHIPDKFIGTITRSWLCAMRIAKESPLAERIRSEAKRRKLSRAKTALLIGSQMAIQELLMGKYSPVVDVRPRRRIHRRYKRGVLLLTKDWSDGLSAGLKHPAFRRIVDEAAGRGDIEFFASLGSAVSKQTSGKASSGWQNLSKEERHMVLFWLEVPSKQKRPLCCLSLKELTSHLQSETGTVYERDAIRKLRDRLGLLSLAQCLRRRRNVGKKRCGQQSTSALSAPGEP